MICASSPSRALRDLEAPAHRRARQHARRARRRAASRRGNCVAVVEVRRCGRCASPPTRRRAVPQRARREGRRAPCAADLAVEARIGLEEALVGRAARLNSTSPSGPISAEAIIDRQHIVELVVEIARDRGDQHPVEREAAARAAAARSTPPRSRSCAATASRCVHARGGAAAAVGRAAAAVDGQVAVRRADQASRVFEAVAEAADRGDDVLRRASCGCA